MNRFAKVLLASLFLSACSGEATRRAQANEITAEADPPGEAAERGGRPAPPVSASCAAHLQVSIAEPFGSPDTSFGGDRESLRTQAGALFRTVAGQMCSAGEIAPAAFQPYRRLLVQYGGGADNSVFYSEPSAEEALLFQYAFEAGGDGKFMLPEANDVHDGLLCHFAADAHRDMCADRLP